MKRELAMIACGLLLTGCASSGSSKSASAAKSGSPGIVAKATDAQIADLLGRVKSLDGEWEMTGPGGEKGTIVFKTIAGGSAVREIMFPGTEHEMTNLYHVDGPTLVVTHYCAAGNQPHMRATQATGNSIVFICDSVSNLTAKDQTYMGGLTLVFKDANHITQKWAHMADGKTTLGPDFDLTRK